MGWMRNFTLLAGPAWGGGLPPGGGVGEIWMGGSNSSGHAIPAPNAGSCLASATARRGGGVGAKQDQEIGVSQKLRKVAGWVSRHLVATCQ